MQKKIINILKKNTQILALGLLIIITISFTSYFNYLKKTTNKNIVSFINNLYLKKTLNSVFDEFEPKYKKVNYKVTKGDSFNKIFAKYSIDQKEIELLKKKIKKNLQCR